MQKLGVIGNGFVGGAIARGFGLHADVKIYDKNPKRSIHTMEEVCHSDFVFLCLPSPMMKADGGPTDLSIIESVCGQLSDEQAKNPIYILKSTVPIGTTEKLRIKYGLKIIHNPEFLTARNADIDFLTPARTILGGSAELVAPVVEFYSKRFPGNNILLMSSDESEAVKYICNCFFAVKVIFFNEMKIGLKDPYNIDWDKVMEGVLTDGRIGISHYDVPGHDGKYGYGGLCVLPSATVKLKNGSLLTVEKLKKAWDNEYLHKNELYVESTNYDIQRLEYKAIQNVTLRNVDEELYVFNTGNGEFICTGEHYMPVQRDGKKILFKLKK